ncbi:MAG: hypothetical protein HY721_23075 [Planctomycetes bacterium]|nr:hypothetical protein [Planctomycetota bacterium]
MREVLPESHAPTTRALVVLCILSAAASAPLLGFCDRFRRGDANGDGDVDLSDPVATLLFLFAGDAQVTCMDAADADDTGKVELTDAIYTLGHLFLGTSAPPAPGPSECGRDETSDPLGCDQQDACDPPAEPRDVSGFRRFEYHQDPGLGFCPELDRVFTASIERQGNGAYRLEVAVLREGDPATDDCLIELRGIPCAVLEPLPPRDLTSEEVRRTLEAFSEVQVRGEADPICQCIAIDPCRIASFQWDEWAASDFLCFAPYLDPSASTAILDLLESFRPGP